MAKTRVKKSTGSKTKVVSEKAKTKVKVAGTKKVRKMKPNSTESLIGKALPPLVADATGGKKVNLKDHLGQKVVLYFYPKDMTPGCTIEGHEFSKLKDQFTARNAVIYGISRDPVSMHEKFKVKECYTIDLLADVDETFCNTFKVIKDKNMYGKKVRGIERSTFIINEKGEIEKEWRGVKAEGHAGEVLKYLQQK